MLQVAPRAGFCAGAAAESASVDSSSKMAGRIPFLPLIEISVPQPRLSVNPHRWIALPPPAIDREQGRRGAVDERLSIYRAGTLRGVRARGPFRPADRIPGHPLLAR